MSELKIEYRAVDALIPFARNSRTHTDAQVAQIARSIKDFGWTNPILIDPENGIIAGHGRLLAARKMAMPEVPTITLFGLSDAQKRALVIADNKLALNAGWDNDTLSAELADLLAGGFDMGLIGFDDKELKFLLSDDEDAHERDGLADPDHPPICKVGDIWALGRHRLVCGDTSDKAVQDAVLCGKVPDLTMFDPPFKIDDAWSWFVKSLKALIFVDYKFVPKALKCGAEYSTCYQFVWDNMQCWWNKNRPLSRHKSAFYFADDEFWDYDAAIVFDKKERKATKSENSRGMFLYEPLPNNMVHLQTLYKKQRALPKGAYALSSVFAAAKSAEQMESEHPHSKPIDWVKALISGAGGGLILDQFAGSGTSFLAAPENATVCGIELNPANCDLILARWLAATGQEGVRA